MPANLYCTGCEHIGSHQNGSVSTAAAALSIASEAGVPTPGTTETTAPPTRIGTVATLVKEHPDSPTTSSRSVSHLIPSILRTSFAGTATDHSAVVVQAEATLVCRQATHDADPAGLVIAPYAPIGNAIRVPAPTGPTGEQDSLGRQHARGSGYGTSTAVPRRRRQRTGAEPTCGHSQRRACEAGESVCTCRGGRVSACAGGTAGWNASCPAAWPRRAARPAPNLTSNQTTEGTWAVVFRPLCLARAAAVGPVVATA
jgi:hypothetical protein